MSHDKNVHDKKMHDKKSYDKKENENIIEGRNAVMEAFRSGKPVDKLYVLDGCQDGAVNSSRDADAVFKSTPTLFTLSSTTPLNASSSFFWFISC